MAQKVMTIIKLQIPAGQANPAPPVGPALGQHGVNIMEFCKQYNARTMNDLGQIIPVEITVYEDRSFTFVTKTPPAARLLLEAAGPITMDKVREVAKTKLPDLNTNDIDAAVRILEGTARSMGLEVVGE